MSPTSWTTRTKPVTSWTARTKPLTAALWSALDFPWQLALPWQTSAKSTPWTTRTKNDPYWDSPKFNWDDPRLVWDQTIYPNWTKRTKP
jgi:hypothetical protein